jgi:hypothetical protein
LKIEIARKVAYGMERFYPINEDAKFLLNLIGRPSFTRRQLKLINEKGWEIIIKAPQFHELFGEDQ